MSPMQLSQTALFVLCLACLITIFSLIVRLIVRKKKEDRAVSLQEARLTPIRSPIVQLEEEAMREFVQHSEAPAGFFERLENLNKSRVDEATINSIPQGEEEKMSFTSKEYGVADQPMVPKDCFEQGMEPVLEANISEIKENWKPFEVVESIGNFEIFSPTADTFKWRVKGLANDTLLVSKADYASERTCTSGILSVIKILGLYSDTLFEIIKEENKSDLHYTYSLRAKNGKEIGVSQYPVPNVYTAEQDIKMIILLTKDNKVNKNKQP